MADIDLPLWSIPPNWAGTVTERLSWLTDVMTSRSGAEQRRAIRLSPRREFEFKINPINNVRSYFDQWMHRISDEKCLLPLWHDKSKLAAAAADAATRLVFPTIYTEFEEGGLAVLFADAFTYELVEIDSIDADGIDLAAPLADPWAKGSVVYPLRRAWLDPQVRTTALTSRVGEASLLFMVDGANDYDPGDEVLDLYAGYPVITLEPNRQDDLEAQFVRTLEEFDGQIGLIRRFDEVGRSFQTQFYNWQAKGRQQHHELRQQLYRMQGRQKAFWMPSFNEDLRLSRALAIGSNRLDIQQIGYTALGGAIAGRDRILIADDDRTPQVLQVTGTSAALGPGEERLNLSAVSTFDAAAGRTASFMSPMRLENDTVEIVHHTDSSGVCEVGVACKSFADTRNAVAPFISPRPEAVMDELGCGELAPIPQAPVLRFKQQFLGPLIGHDPGDRIGEPALGYWMQPQFRAVAVRGPDEFVCYDYGAWAYPYDESLANDYETAQWVQCRIQGGSGTAGCPKLGAGYEALRTMVHKPGWPTWRTMLAATGSVSPQPGGGDHELLPDPITGIGGNHGTGFPGTMYFWMPADYIAAVDDPIGWAEYTEPYVEP